MIHWEKMIEERDEWIDHNFPNRSVPDPGESLMGMIEELGELTHAVLKSAQDIRGSAVTHQNKMIDAVGDLTVYMLGVMSWAGMSNVDPWQSTKGDFSDPITPRRLLQVLAKLDLAVAATQSSANPYSYKQEVIHYVGVMVAFLIRFCQDRHWDYDEIVNRVWDAVKERDWIKYPDTGLPELGTFENPYTDETD